MGLERLAMISQNTKNVFETDLFMPLINMLPSEIEPQTKRIIADHIRGVVFLISDGVIPSNKESGYVLRRILRRLLVQFHLNDIPAETLEHLINQVIDMYGGFYPQLVRARAQINETAKAMIISHLLGMKNHPTVLVTEN